MRKTMMAAGILVAALGGAGAAGAQELEIKDAAARVIVIPEARGDVQVAIRPGRAGLPVPRVGRRGGSVEIDGGLKRRIQGCVASNGVTAVTIRGVGRVAVGELPVITARVPLAADVSASGAVFGEIGRTQSLDLALASCGAFRVANVTGALEVAMSGSGDLTTGASRRAEVSLAGSGDVRLGPVTGPLEVSIAGSGDVRAVSAGSVQASIVGSGDVIVGGRTGAVNASIVGSGDVRVDGEAQSLDASIMGSGDVRIQRVLGPVRRNVAGSGDVIVGR